MSKLQPEFETITPAKAEKMLELNTMNRTISQGLVTRYSADMKKGHWDEQNGETIKLAEDGTVIDGQHRLWAVVESGMAVKFLVVRNVPKESFKTVDTGRTRSSGDVVGIAGIPNQNSIAAAAVMLICFKKKKITFDTNSAAKYATKLDVVNFSIEHSEELQKSVHATINRGCGKYMGSGSLVALHYMFARSASGSPEMADVFFEQLGRGVFDNRFELASHPIRVLREKLILNRQSVARMRSGMLMAFIIKAWNSYVAGRAMRLLVVKPGESYPAIS